jgi:predicted enzyme related to lactoylglutathione lyase
MPASGSLLRPPRNRDPGNMYGDQPYMVNLRVEDMDQMLAHLEREGVDIVGRQDEDYGRFAWAMDPDGNRLELYQPRAGG